MRSWPGIRLLLLTALTGCAGVTPDPAAASIDDLPVVELDDQALARRTELEQSAMAAVVQRQFEEASEFAERALGVDPRSARARAVLGMVSLQRAAEQDPIEGAGLRRGEEQLAMAQQLAPADAFVGWMQAVFLAECGHLSAAAAAAEAALARCEAAPASEKAALLGIAGTYRYELGEERAALPHLDAYTALRSDDATAHFRLGACLLVLAKTPQGVPPPYRQAQRNAELAADAFRRCVELAPGDEDAASSVASALLRAAELARLKRDGDGASRPAEAAALEQQALDQLRVVAEAFPDSADARFRLAVVAKEQGDQELAEASYRAALERDAGHEGSLMNLAALAVEAGDAELARGLLERLLQSDAERRGLSSDERRRVRAWLER